VVWENTTNSSNINNFVLNLNGTDHIRLKHITFKHQGSIAARNITLIGVVDSVTIDSCRFLGYQGSTSHNFALIYGNEIDAAGLKIMNSTLTDEGGHAIYLSSSNSSSSPTGLVISNNTITDTYGGIYARYDDGVTIRGNTIKGSYLHGQGIDLRYCDGANVIEDNRIYAPDLTYGIYLNYCQAASGNEAVIANNVITAEDHGIYLYQHNYYYNIYYNSVRVRDNYALYTQSGNSNNRCINNILYTDAASTPAAYIYNTSVLTSSDHNDFYTAYAYQIYYSVNKTLAQWQAYGQDSNSVSIDPLFNADSSLVPESYILDNKGTPIASITDDINGTTRSETTPDMGAMEFTVEGSPLSGIYMLGAGADADYDSISTALNDLSIYGISGWIIVGTGLYIEYDWAADTVNRQIIQGRRNRIIICACACT
jgi:parallel beta-helix repeat protein